MMRVLTILITLLFALPAWSQETELTNRRGEIYKIFTTGKKREYRLQAYSGIVHYKENYKVAGHPWLDIDPEFYTETIEYREYSRLPNIVRVFKDKVGYEIFERKTGAVHSVILETIDGKDAKNRAWKDPDIDFEMQVGEHRVGLWKTIKSDKAVKPLKFKVIHDATGDMKFLGKPVAFDTSTGEAVDVVTKKESVDANSFYWTETPPKEGIKIDTDYYAETNDGWVSLSLGEWATTRDTAEGEDVGTASAYHISSMDAEYDLAFTVFRSFFSFDTSGIHDGGIVTAASLSIKGHTNWESSVSAQKWTGGQAILVADYSLFSGSEYGHVTWADAYNTITFNSTGMTDINKTGYTDICCREYAHDYLDVSPGTFYRNGCYFANNAGTDADPYLSVTYTIPSAQIIVINTGN